MVELFIIRIEDTDHAATSRRPAGVLTKTFVGLGMDWDESPETRKLPPIRALELYQKYIDQLLARREKPTNLTLQKKSWQLNVNAKRRVKHLATSANTSAWAKKRKSYLYRDLWKQQVSFNGSLGSQWVRYLQMAWYGQGDIEFEGGNIGGDWVIQKKKWLPTYNFAL